MDNNKYLRWGLILFLIFMFDFISAFIANAIDGVNIFSFSYLFPNYQVRLLQLGLTITFWALSLLIFSRYTKNTLKTIINFSFTKKELVMSIVYLLVALLIKLAVNQTFIPQIYLEYESYNIIYHDLGLLIILIQIIYYICEFILIVFMLSLFQKWGELKNKKYGWIIGILFLAFTWGGLHILTKGLVSGLILIISSLLIGYSYLLSNKSFWATIFFIAGLFLL